MADWDDLLGDLEARRAAAHEGGGARRVQREHDNGRFTARERISLLVDEGTFRELGMLVTTPADDGTERPSTFICGTAEIDGRPVAIGAEDFTVLGGGVGSHLQRYKGGWGGFIEELAYEYGIPLVLLMQGVGGSVAMQESKGYPVLLSGQATFPVFELLDRVPVVTAVLGPTAGSSAARAAISHFSLMTRANGCLFAGGPPLVKQATGVDVDKFELGGADVHTQISGVIDNAVDSEEEAFDGIRDFLAFLPPNITQHAPRAASVAPRLEADSLLETLSPNSRRVYDPYRVVDAVCDAGTFFEIAPDYGSSLRVGLARIDGWTVGVLATDPRVLGGAMDGPSSDKQVRFVELCDAFHVPLVYFVDVPGFMIGPDAERSGVLRRGSRALHAIHRATVPVYTVQLRRSFGLAGQGTGSANRKSLRLAWPTGTWGDLPVTSGIEAEFRAEIEAADDPVAKRQEIIERFEKQGSMWRTVEKFGVEDVIDPRETRPVLAHLLGLAYRAPVDYPKRGPQVRP